MAKASTSKAQSADLEILLKRIRACRVCVEAPKRTPRPHEPRPVLRASTTARLLIASQAPGTKVYATGIPFNDASGDRLRRWMDVSRDIFYDTSKVAIVPMGFCFPGQDAKKADLPPRPECRETWHDELFQKLPQIETILAIGRYAQNYHFERLGRPLPKGLKLDELVHNWRDYAGSSPRIIALPHPSWRNTGWLKRNLWFETDVLPAVRDAVMRALEP